MSIEISLAGKAAIVTGAARGIGFAISQLLASAGASVLLVDIDAVALDKAAESLPGAVSLAGDLSDSAFPAQVIQRSLEAFGSVDILVNNAGYTWDSVIQKTTDEQFQTMLNIHSVAPFRTLRAASHWIRETAKTEMAAGQMVVRKVVNITSISGMEGNAGQVAYSAGKAAVIGLTKTLSKEWGRYNVTVNAVGFGLIETRLTQPMSDPETLIDVGKKQVRVGMQENIREQVLQSIPLRRFGTTQDAANTVLFFCSPLSDYVTGEVLLCGGGVHF